MFAEITEDHGDSCISPRDQTYSPLSQRENELIRKQGGSGVSAEFRTEKSSKPAEITAGMEEGDCGTATCLDQGLVNNSTARVFNRMWSQPQGRLWVQETMSGLWGLWREAVWVHSTCYFLPGTSSLALLLQYPSAISKLLGCSCAWKDSAAPSLNLFFLLEICRNRVYFTCFLPGLLGPALPGRGLSDATKMSRFVHKVRTG